jgi:NADH dehydrogenase [ubiquinone] 1 alpha subcomplex assembly factor 6
MCTLLAKSSRTALYTAASCKAFAAVRPAYATPTCCLQEYRASVFAIRALNVETSRVADLVQRGKDTPILQIRFQWWREAISAALRGQPREHPVLLALAHVNQATPLPRYHLTRLLETRESDQVLGQQPATLQELEQYADGTASQVGRCWHQWHGSTTPPSAARIELPSSTLAICPASPSELHQRQPCSWQAIACCNPPATHMLTPQLGPSSPSTPLQVLHLQLAAAGVKDSSADHAASHLGKAIGIATVLKGSLHHSSQRRTYLPLDLCAQHRLSQEDVYRAEASDAVRDVALQVACAARDHLRAARAMRDKVPAAGRRVLLQSVATEEYLTQLEAKNFNIFDPSLMSRVASPMMHVLRLKYHMLRGSF